MARKKLSLEVNNPLLRGPSLVNRQVVGSPYRELAINEIDVDPDQPRRVFDTESLAELAASIKEHGVLCPILVRVGDAGTYRVVSGERRLRASKLAGLTTIPAVVDRESDSDSGTLLKQLVENMQRSDLTSMERALAIGQLRDTFTLSIRDIAKRLGVSKGIVQRSLEILDLPDDLQAALIAGAHESKVLLLSQVADREMRKVLLSELDSLTREELEARIQGLPAAAKIGEEEAYHGGTKRSRTKKSGAASAEDQRIMNDIQRALGMRVLVARRRGKPEQGRLMVDFYSAEDLREVYRRLTAGA